MNFGPPSPPILAEAPRRVAAASGAGLAGPEVAADEAGPDRDGLPDGAPLAARVLAVLSSCGLGAVLPILMVVANKSAPATLGLAALCANLAAYRAGYGLDLGRRYKALLGSPTALMTAAFTALCALSLAWSIDPAFTRRGLVEGLPELIFALAAAAAWPLVARRRDAGWLIAGILLAGVLIALEKALGMPLHALLRERGEAWDLKRSAIPPVLLLWPALAYCFAQGKPRLAAGLVGAAAVGVVFSHSGAPGFALIASILVWAIARLVPRAAVAAVGLSVALLIGLGPWAGSVASRLLPPSAEAALQEEHASHRMQIWSAFEDRAHDRPILGHGFDSSFRVSQAPRPVGGTPGPDNEAMFDNHPHNVFLQLWVELGLVGALAGAAACAYLLVRLGRRHPETMGPRLALLVSVAGVGLVGLSAWQPWWLATIVTALLWFGLIGRRFEA